MILLVILSFILLNTSPTLKSWFSDLKHMPFAVRLKCLEMVMAVGLGTVKRSLCIYYH